MKFVEPRPYADPEAAACKLLEIANATEAVQDGRIHIERINGPFLYEHKGSPAEYKAGLDLAIAKGWLWLHETREIHRCRRAAVCVKGRIRNFAAGCLGAAPNHAYWMRWRGWRAVAAPPFLKLGVSHR